MREKDGVIYFSVTSDGTTGEGWITRLETKGFRVSRYAEQVLRSPRFAQTSGVTTEVAVLKGTLFKDQSRFTKKIGVEAAKRKLGNPNVEVACLIREKFTDSEIEAMGLSFILIMHEPIKLSLLCVTVAKMVACAARAVTGIWWDRNGGFAFAVAEKGQTE